MTEPMPTEPLPVVLVGFDGVQPLDLVGPHEVFAGANAHRRATGQDDAYRIQVAATRAGVIRSGSGLGLVADGGLPAGPVDTFVVAGGSGALAAAEDPELIGWVRETASRARRTCSVCTGAFVLAASGVLDGRRATTHWAWADELAAARPAARVDPAPLFVRDGPVWTSAGVTAGIDLTLALVEEDLGTAVAQSVARRLVLFLRRSGGQSQFAAEVWTDPPERDCLRQVVRAVHVDPGADHSLPALAARAGLSVRHLQRSFARELGATPAAYVTRVRVDAARRLLEQEQVTVDVAARRCGFGSAETMRRAFQRQLGVSPDVYRGRFAGHL